MNYERLAGAPKYRDDRVTRRSRQHADREEQRRANREEQRSARREAREKRAAELLEQKMLAARERAAKKRFAATIAREDRHQRQTSAAYYKQRKADEAARRADRRASPEPVQVAPRVLPPLPYGDAVLISSRRWGKSADRDARRAREAAAHEQWRRDNPEAAAASDAAAVAHEAYLAQMSSGT